MTVAEKTLAALHAELSELRNEHALETDRRWRTHLSSRMRDVQRRIEQVHTWAETPMGRKEVA